MDIYTFQKAKAVWCRNAQSEYNQFAGFFTEINLEKAQQIRLAIAARSYYRLFINGTFAASGPARTAEHYCRVDELGFKLEGKVTVAIEVAALDSPDHYSNDCTLEPGMMIAEITDETGKVLAATGTQGWFCRELTARRPYVETMSHCRGIIEVYDLNENSYDWINGNSAGMEAPAVLTEEITYLKRRAPYARYTAIPMRPLSQISDWVKKETTQVNPDRKIAKMFNHKWYSMVPAENCFLDDLLIETDSPFSGEVIRQGNRTKVMPGENAAALLYQMPQVDVGFIELNVSVEEDCVLDLFNTDHREMDGTVAGNTYVCRYHLKKGSYHLMPFEPKLVRYVKLVLRTKGSVTVEPPVLREYTYPDELECTFECNDGDVNRIYDAARKTLRLNTLDIFMDCPERERGGWLCDSQFSARGAWQLFGDFSVEKDFIENFMLTDGAVKWHGFFPEVFPGAKKTDSDVGIQNWSFYLLTEIYDYYQRSGDQAFIDECRARVECFMEGLLALRGESGLIEGITAGFVDWSLANRDFAIKPISIPINCLAVCLMEKMAELYQVPEWKTAADEMRALIESVDADGAFLFGGSGDGAVYKDGRLRRTDCCTEGGIALELWSGFHYGNRRYVQDFVQKMGYRPKYRPNPYIGKANIFIGLMLRFEVLEKLDQIEVLLEELKDLYLPELRDGSGTLFENYSALSGCHGINGAVGAMLTEHVLGLGHPLESKKTIRIAPRVCGLNWATGTAKCTDGMIYMSWKADDFERKLEVTLQIPKGWTPEFDFGAALKGWTVTVNGKEMEA